MTHSPHVHAPDVEFLDRAELEALQARKLRALLEETVPANRFYAEKLRAARVAPSDVRSLADLRRLPFTTRDELTADQAASPPYGSNLTGSADQALRLFQTSGTSSGRPLRWLYSRRGWDWVLRCWATILRANDVVPSDRFFFPFSFGPFLGFWAAFEGATRLGNFCLPGGGLSTAARLRLMADNAATVVCCTPTYALRMAEVAEAEGIDLAATAVRALIVAGEPGGSIPAVRGRIESAWGARVFDHTGMTEIGSLGFECHESPGTGVHLLESECVAEVVDPATGEPLDGDAEGELVLTNLGNELSPIVRYRTGDLVRLTRGRCACGRSFARMEGGILGRADDMVIIKGNNVYPGALEAALRGLPEVAEYRAEAICRPDGNALRLTIEPSPRRPLPEREIVERVKSAIRDAFHFGAEVILAEPGSLPRFDLKAKRFAILRGEARATAPRA